MDPISSLREIQPRLEQTMRFAQHQLRSLVTKHPDAFSMYTESGKWSISGER